MSSSKSPDRGPISPPGYTPQLGLMLRSDTAEASDLYGGGASLVSTLVNHSSAEENSDVDVDSVISAALTESTAFDDQEPRGSPWRSILGSSLSVSGSWRNKLKSTFRSRAAAESDVDMWRSFHVANAGKISKNCDMSEPTGPATSIPDHSVKDVMKEVTKMYERNPTPQAEYKEAETKMSSPNITLSEQFSLWKEIPKPLRDLAVLSVNDGSASGIFGTSMMLFSGVPRYDRISEPHKKSINIAVDPRTGPESRQEALDSLPGALKKMAEELKVKVDEAIASSASGDAEEWGS